MSYWAMLGCALVGMGIVFMVVPLALRAAPLRNRLQRGQDLHHTHQRPTPRLGGLALAIAFIGIEVFISFCFPEHRLRTPGLGVVALSSLAMFGLGFWDDLKPLGAKRKLAGQILIAVSVYVSGVGIERFRVPFVSIELDLGGWGILLTVLWLVGMTNLINLIDGMDGLAGGICLMLMGLLAYVGHDSGSYAFLAAGMTGALIGFLCFNFPPARIYLGDSGSYFLGFQIGLLAIVNSHKGTVLAALVAPLFVLALPILDTTLAVLRRALRGLPVFRPDRRHLHHHLLDMGFSGRKVLLSLYAVTSVFLAMGLAAYWSRGNLVPVLLGAGALLLLLCAGRLNFSRSWFAVGRVVGHSLEMRREVEYALALTRSVAQALQGGRLGTLELEAASCEAGALAFQGTQPCERSCCPCVADDTVFGVVSELLAEGWVTAASRLTNDNQLPLRFDTRRSSPNHPSADGTPLSGGPALPTQTVRPAADALVRTVR